MDAKQHQVESPAVKVPTLDIRTARLYQYVDNQTSNQTRTSRGMKQLRLATNEAENRLYELQQLSARLADDASGKEWWEHRWNLLNGRISVAPSFVSTIYHDDLPKPRQYPQRPKMIKTRRSWTQSGHRIIHTSSTSTSVVTVKSNNPCVDEREVNVNGELTPSSI